MEGVVSLVHCEKVLKVFSLEPRILPTGKPVDTIRQAKLSTSVKAVRAVCRYDIPLPRYLRSYKHMDRQTLTQNTSINII